MTFVVFGRTRNHAFTESYPFRLTENLIRLEDSEEAAVAVPFPELLLLLLLLLDEETAGVAKKGDAASPTEPVELAKPPKTLEDAKLGEPPKTAVREASWAN